MRRVTTAAIATFLNLSAAQAQDGSYTSEQAARACIHARLIELVAQERPSNTPETRRLMPAPTN